jgi:WD40 repeat protein
MMAPGAHLGGYFSGSLTLRGLPDGEVIQRRPIRTDGITAISTPAKGRLIAFATGDVHGSRGHVRVWDPDTGKERYLRGHTVGVNALAFSRDGTTLVSGGADRKVILWDAETGEKRWVLDHPRSVSTLALSPDGKRVAVGSWGGEAEPASIVLYETATGNRLTTISARDGGIHDLVFSPTRDAVAWAGPDKSIRVWQNGMAEDGLTLRGHGEAVRSLAFSPDGNTLASGSDDGTVKLWDLATGQERLTLTEPSGAVVTVRFFDAGRSLVAGDSNGSVWIWTGWNSP